MTRAMVCAALALLIPTALLAAEIHDAAERGDLDQLRRLIVEDPAGVDARTVRGSTPLHFACVGGNLPTVEYLVSSGADVNATNDSHHTPLHYAAARDHAEIVALLLDRGAGRRWLTRGGLRTEPSGSNERRRDRKADAVP